MNMENNLCTTPKQTKRLGLRCSSRIINKRENNVMESSETENPVSTAKRRLPQSDMKINYKNLEHNDVNKSDECNASGMDTPNNMRSANLIRSAVSTNCRPYRLALSKRVRDRMTNRRLEFYLANEIEREATEEISQREDKKEEDNKVTKNANNSREELLQQIEIVRKELSCRQEHLKKVEELKQAIAVWKTGFSLAVNDLQEKVEPRLETAALLEQLHIPQEMIKYIND